MASKPGESFARIRAMRFIEPVSFVHQPTLPDQVATTK
jgi:hypothetical protein